MIYFYIDERNHERKAVEISSVWDDNGETLDRYTVVFGDGKTFVGLSDNPSHPLGFSQCGELREVAGDYLGNKIDFKDLPREVQEHVLIRFAE